MYYIHYVLYTLCTIYNIVYSQHYTLYNMHYILFTLHYILYTVQYNRNLSDRTVNRLRSQNQKHLLFTLWSPSDITHRVIVCHAHRRA